MDAIIMVLEAAEDNTLHLPVPEFWRHRPIRVHAELAPPESLCAKSYTAEWKNAFGSITDESFTSPSRDTARPAESLDT